MFFGIVIGLFYREHGRPHFHAVYAEFEAVIDIEKGEVISDELPKRALNLVSEWRSEHVAELREDWEIGAAASIPEENSASGVKSNEISRHRSRARFRLYNPVEVSRRDYW